MIRRLHAPIRRPQENPRFTVLEQALLHLGTLVVHAFKMASSQQIGTPGRAASVRMKISRAAILVASSYVLAHMLSAFDRPTVARSARCGGGVHEDDVDYSSLRIASLSGFRPSRRNYTGAMLTL